MLFDSWHGLLRVLLLSIAAYAGLLALLRWSGNRTLAKLSAFDLVVTVALGSCLATIILTSNVALAEGVLAMTMLVLLQYAIAALSVRYPQAAKLARNRPRCLLKDGDYDDRALKAARVTRGDVRAAIRGQGHGDISAIAAVVIEADGSLSVIARAALGDASALEGGGANAGDAERGRGEP
ncbi:DUF421 domain-containing protein [Sphingopyxis terrae]|uniref:DUF421 domain-containing protein n=1 Tax=Sphingopyxis terrae subsp. ummariensis TaxID=429001 RepID=A0A1Y6FTL4_9SPHN|nr:YetF domain-containing protein [Sphingopyxis terrae]PCF91319.1 DUF421 domain-containing protein [Sphingopyxis terrae subsp. ummariensis]SMQ76490.1 Protein of unknown function [Sphingopyxis terrae subsp. ummariensis]